MPLIDLEEGGGGVQSFTGVITDSFFSTNEYGTSLCLKSTLDDPENFPTFEDGTFTRYFPCGPKWETENDGETIVHPDGPDKKFNLSTRVGQLCTAVNAVPGIEDAVAADFSPYKASSWKGLHLTWGQVPVQKRRMKKDENGADTGQWESYEATELLPVALAGTTAEGQTALLVDLDTLELTSEQVAALVALPRDVTDPKFLEGVIGLGLASNGKVMTVITENMAGFRNAIADAEPF